MKNSSDNVFDGIPLRTDDAQLLTQFLNSHDLSPHTRRAFRNDLVKFARWFSSANNEPLCINRVTMRDVADFRDSMRRQKCQAVATVNRALVTIRRLFTWLVERGNVPNNPATQVKELRRVMSAPKGLERHEVRRLLREVELRGDVRANAVFSLLLFTGCRVGDVVNLELDDLILNERSGLAVFRFGKGSKQRSVPLPISARRPLQTYLEIRPAVECRKVFLGERGALTDRGVRALCSKYGAAIGIHLHPHVFRHTMAKQFLAENGNDLVSLAQILGHESLNTTSRYTQKSQAELASLADRLSF